MIHRTIRIVLRSELVISNIVTIILFFKFIKSTDNSDEKLFHPLKDCNTTMSNSVPY